MAGILGKDTKPEIIVRRYLHACGFRYRLHRKDLPGTPDLVLSKYRLAIFVHGCFWHRHLGCIYATTPGNRREFWEDKLNKNVLRDQKQVSLLIERGWRVVIVWECGLKHLSGEISTLQVMIKGANERFQVWPEKPPKVKL
ncbi:very short patch repair endonuclease [Pseudomonas putida]|uniref:very short patch repair endonuclease n=1 Tax=Pseudomonas putida TaxID=303 RepID=UPI003D9698A8